MNDKILDFLCEFRKDRDTNLDKGMDLNNSTLNGQAVLAILAEVDSYNPCELMMHNEQDEKGIKLGYDMAVKIFAGALLDNLNNDILCVNSSL